ncbi:MAG: LysE family transporter [Gammaproteobacteria bacterium]|nr:LysE family transporter [Gammaproteobacteria bacterium]
MPFLAIFATSFVVALSGALMPGPLLTVTISESPRRGLIAGPLLILGHGLLELALVTALIFGLAPLLQQPVVFVATALTGAVVLMWMAWGMFRALPGLTLHHPSSKATGRNLVVAGILLSIANPYWTIWWVTIGLGYITHSLTFGVWGAIVFFSGHILADLLWYTAISTAVWKGRGFLSDRVYRLMIGGCAVFLVVFAGLFAASGIRSLLA